MVVKLAKTLNLKTVIFQDQIDYYEMLNQFTNAIFMYLD